MIDFIVDSITSSSFLAGTSIDTKSFVINLFFVFLGNFFNQKKLVNPVMTLNVAIKISPMYQ